MTVLRSTQALTDARASANAASFERLRAELQAARNACDLGGGARALELHRSRGKLTARERIGALCDPGTPFLEIGQLAGHGVYDDAVPSGGIVVGVGIVSGRACMVMANDATVKGGSYYPITIKKQLRAQAIARENALPSVYLVDSGGAYLPMQEDIFPDEHHFGRIFRNIAEMSSMGLTQISAVMGSCTAGGAYIPAMSDETVIVQGAGTIFLGGPQLVQAATGEIVDAQRLGGAHVHTAKSGVADHFAQDDLHALSLVRQIVGRSAAPKIARPPLAARAPLHDPEELTRIINANPKDPISATEVLARLLDGSEFVPYRERYGASLLCGTGAIGGYPIGVLINDGVLFSESAQKAANFIELCCQTQVPLLFLHNISGFMVGESYEAGGIAKDGAKMVNAVATARVPKFSIVIGGSYGAGNFAMCGRAFGPRLMAMWPNARTSVMGGEQAAKVLELVRQDQLARQGRQATPEELDAIRQPTLERYDRNGRPLYAAARLWVDAVVDPARTREWLTLGLAMAAASPPEATRFGVFRM